MSATPYRRFIDDVAHLRQLEGQCYVVLRPDGEVDAAYRDVRARVAERLAGLPVSYIAEPHVTLTGFAKGTDRHAIHDLVTEWARGVSPLGIETEKIAVFPPPYQIVIVQVRRTPDLFAALSSLRAGATRRGIGDLPRVPPDEWIFHLSVAYCPRLEQGVWDEVARTLTTALTVPSARCVVDAVEIVTFDEGQESCGGQVSLTGG